MKRIILLIVMGSILANADLSGAPVSPAQVMGYSAPDRSFPLADTTHAVVQFMQKVQQAYKNASYLSFNLLYRYANKNEPSKYIDTLAGEIAMDKNQMRLTIDDVETITTDHYTIQVLKEDKLIYLSTPKPAMSIDPIHMLDTILVHMHGIQTHIVRNKETATLYISFPAGQMYKSIAMTIDETTGFFVKVIYELFTEGLLSADQITQAGKSGRYQPEGRIEVLFNNYQQGRFNDSVFNEGIYFTRLGKGNYEPTEQFRDYQIFLASSNL